MKIVEIPIDKIRPAPWNANEMDPEMRSCLHRSVVRFGPVVPPVVRQVDLGQYETVGGAQRLEECRALGLETITCVLVQLNDAEAMLLSQALNHITGSDNPGLRGALIRSILASVPLDEVLAVLPETSAGLQSLASLGQDTLAEQLMKWSEAQQARLKHLTFQLTPDQLPVVERALRQALSQARQVQGESPNLRGTALFLICSAFLGKEGDYGNPTR